MKTELRLSAVALGLLLFGGGMVYVLSSQPVPVQTALQVLQVPVECQLDLADCIARDENGHQLQISLSPRPVPLMQEVRVLATLKDVHAIQTVDMEIEGVNMFMGQQKAALSVSGANWTGSFALPICSKTLMHWQISIQIKTDTLHYRAVFPFSTSR